MNKQQNEFHVMIKHRVSKCIYCDNCSEFYFLDGATKKELIEGARKAGWIIGEQDICPKCSYTREDNVIKEMA